MSQLLTRSSTLSEVVITDETNIKHQPLRALEQLKRHSS